MTDKASFVSALDTSYQFQGATITLGTGVLNGEVISNHFMKVPLRMMNRHGLTAGATGTGKAKSL